MIKQVKNPWKAIMAGVLNDIIDALNCQKPLRGNGILMDETPSGTIVSVANSGSANTDSTGSTSSGGGSSSDDDSPEDIAISLLTARVAILEQEMPIGTWKQVTVVDPANGCAQSTISVFVKN